MVGNQVLFSIRLGEFCFVITRVLSRKFRKQLVKSGPFFQLIPVLAIKSSLEELIEWLIEL